MGLETDAAPHDWTIQFELPTDLDFLSAELDPLEGTTPSCSYNAGNRRVVCVATGDAPARGGPGLFAHLRVRVHDDVATGSYPFTACAYSQLPPGAPLNSSGQSTTWEHFGSPTTSCAAGSQKATFNINYQIGTPPVPPDPRTGNSLVDLDKTRTAPVGSAVDPGDEVTYRLDYSHLPESDGDLHGAYVYDFLGRHPVTGVPQGDLVPEFVSARTTYVDGLPEDLEYTCTPNSSLANGATSWSSSPCGTVTGVRWRLNSTVAPDDPPGSYRVTDPPGHVLLTVRAPLTALPGDELVNVSGIDADLVPAAAGERVTTTIGGDAPVVDDLETTTLVPNPVDFSPPHDDPDGDIDLTTTEVLTVDHGTAVAHTDGSITYTPDPTFDGDTALVTYQICDLSGLCDEGTATVHLDYGANPPVVGDRTISATFPEPRNFGINASDPDFDLDPDSLRVVSVDTGTTEVDIPDQRVTWTPDPGFAGNVAHVVVEMCDVGGRCDQGTITININHLPDAVDDTATVNPGGFVLIDTYLNDSDPDGNFDLRSGNWGFLDEFDHGFAELSAGASGTGSGVIRYYPENGFTGTDTATYEVCDQDACATAEITVTVAVTPTHAPIAVDDAVETAAGNPIVIRVLANDTDEDNDLDPESVTITEPASGGTVYVNPDNGVIAYTPDHAEVGAIDTFNYQVCDAFDLCDFATVTVTQVEGSGPDAVDDVASNPDRQPITIDVLANDTDPDDDIDPTTVEIIGGTNGGSVAVDTVTGEITYTYGGDPGIGDTFTYEVCDLTGLCDQATVVVVFAPPPNAVDDEATVTQGESVVVDVLANDTDPVFGFDPSTVAVVDDPTQGTTSVDPVTGEITYTADADATGTDIFTYRMCDFTGLCDEAEVTIHVTGPPTAVDDPANVVPGEPTVIDVVANDSDPDGDLDPTTVTVTTPATQGITSVDPVTGAITYVSGPAATGTDTFTYEICDELGACDEATVTITFVQPPDAVDDPVSAVAGEPTTIDVLANDTDPDDDLDPGSVEVTTAPTQGTVSIDDVTGQITYTPVDGATGTDTFTYQVCDVTGLCDEATVTVTFVHAPVAVDDPVVAVAGCSAGHGCRCQRHRRGRRPRPDVGRHRVRAGPGHGDGGRGLRRDHLHAERRCDRRRLRSPTRSATTRGSATGRRSRSRSATRRSPWTTRSRPPPARPQVVDVAANDTDPDDDLDPTTVTITDPADKGTTSVNPTTGAVTYTSGPGATGTDTFSYQICDETGLCDEATVTVTIGHPPNAVDDAVTQIAGDTTVIDVLANDTDPDGDLDRAIGPGDDLAEQGHGDGRPGDR